MFEDTNGVIGSRKSKDNTMVKRIRTKGQAVTYMS